MEMDAATEGVTGGNGRTRWVVGDHHVHSTFSPDGHHTIGGQVRRARQSGVDWMVVTDHGSRRHVEDSEGALREIARARRAFPGMLVFQGLEWNVPGAAHGTVFVSPGPDALDVIRDFERKFDGDVQDAREGSAANELLAVEALEWLGRRVDEKIVDDAIVVVNHPSSDGYNHPRLLRRWRDAEGGVAIGFEGAPGHQGAKLTPYTERVRGFYGYGPRENSFVRYPDSAYDTWGGFDWMTATVGGMWDSLLSEGSRWWITASSDSHLNRDVVRPLRYDRRQEAGDDLEACDFWPGVYSRTHVEVADVTYHSLMRSLRQGRMWVDHGHLVGALDVHLRTTDLQQDVGLGGTLRPRRGQAIEMIVTISTQGRPNPAGLLPELSRVDVIRGAVTGRVDDVDSFTAPDTRVTEQIDTSERRGTYSLVLALGEVEHPMYLRLRGTDARRTQTGLLGHSVDPCGPARDRDADAVDPWLDLWFYTNPVWVEPAG